MHAWILALAAASALAFGGLRQDRPAAGGDPPEATLEAARIALAERSWEAAGKAARTAGARLAAGSPAWYEAAGIEAEAWYELWRPGDVLAVSEAVQRELAALYERLERDPLGASLPIPAMSGAQDASILGALVLQARGEHDRAARWLDGFVENLLRGRIPPTGWARAAPLAGARSHLLTDRPERARGILEGVVRALPGTVEGVVASVLLQAMGDSYAGVYAGDPDHAKRMQAFAALLPDVRRRAERATGMREGALDVVLVGVADIPPGREAESGFTLHDPRRPELAPIVCMYAQTLAASSPEELAAHAVHELVHAACLMELGLAYERLPEWVYEGIAYHAAGQTDELLRSAVAKAWFSDPSRLGEGALERLRPALVHEGADWVDVDLRHAALEVLETGAIRGLIDGLRAGAPYEEVVRGVAGMAPEELEEHAATHVAERALAVLEPSRRFLPLLDAVRASRTPAEATAAARRLLECDPPGFARSFGRLLLLAFIQGGSAGITPRESPTACPEG